MVQSSRGRLIAAAALAAAGVPAVADAPALELSWSVNGGPVNHLTPEGVEETEGVYVYEGVAVDPGSGLALAYDMTAEPEAGLDGNVSLLNDLDGAAEIVIGASLAVDPALPAATAGGSQLTSFVLVGLTTGPGGGALHSMPPYLWQATIDGEVVGPATSLFGHPFFIANGGAANAATSADFGNPEPVPGPPVTATIGYDLRYTITPGDVSAVTTLLSVNGTGCPGDLDGDGAVGITDLSLLLLTWGPCPGACPADLGGDGAVGVEDLLALLAAWGPCPG